MASALPLKEVVEMASALPLNEVVEAASALPPDAAGAAIAWPIGGFWKKP